MKKEKKFYKKQEKQKTQFSKIIIMIILIAGLLFIQESYILAIIGKDNIAEDLSKSITTIIVGTTLGYFLKAYSETKSQKKNELDEKELDAKIDALTSQFNNDSEKCSCDQEESEDPEGDFFRNEEDKL